MYDYICCDFRDMTRKKLRKKEKWGAYPNNVLDLVGRSRHTSKRYCRASPTPVDNTVNECVTQWSSVAQRVSDWPITDQWLTSPGRTHWYGLSSSRLTVIRQRYTDWILPCGLIRITHVKHVFTRDLDVYTPCEVLLTFYTYDQNSQR